MFMTANGARHMVPMENMAYIVADSRRAKPLSNKQREHITAENMLKYIVNVHT